MKTRIAIIGAGPTGPLLGQRLPKAGIDKGARAVVEGEVRGQLLPLHVFADVTRDMEIAREEIFGPLVGIQRARDEAHALELANDSEFGLSSAVATWNVRCVSLGRSRQACPTSTTYR